MKNSKELEKHVPPKKPVTDYFAHANHDKHHDKHGDQHDHKHEEEPPVKLPLMRKF